MKTFTLPPQWDGPVDYQSMAEAGFVYTGQEDLVYCFSCNIKLDRWSKHMEPLLRHKEESPTCSFVRKNLQAVKREKGKIKSVAAPSKPLNARLTSSIGQLQSSSLVTSKAIHTVVTGLSESRLSYGGSFGDRPGASLPITPENYQSEEKRIKSFVGWPLNEVVHPEQLARVGFVYTGEGALVQCFQCGVKYRHWYKGDVPLNVHQKCNPRCSFLQTFVSESKSSLTERQLTRSYTEPESIGNNTEGQEVNLHSLQFPDYSEQAVRLQSFKHWGGVLPAQELAEGGFYMIARRDVVKCFSCKVVLWDWERSDNVIDEHHRHSPDCSFLKTTMHSNDGTTKPTAINLSQFADKASSSPFVSQSLVEEPWLRRFDSPRDSDLLQHPNAESGDSSSSSETSYEETLQYLRQSQKLFHKVMKHGNLVAPVQPSDRSHDSSSPVQSQNGSPPTAGAYLLHVTGGCQETERNSPPHSSYHHKVEQCKFDKINCNYTSDIKHAGMERPIVRELHRAVPSSHMIGGTPVLPENKSPSSSQISIDYRDDVSIHSSSLTRTQSRSAPVDACITMRIPPTNQSPEYDEPTIPGIHYPFCWVQLFSSQETSRTMSDSSDDDSFHSATSCNKEETPAGIRYPSWGQHQSMSPQGASNNIPEGSDDSFHSPESHHGTTDYNIFSINPPKTKVVYEENLSEGVENNISIKTNDSKRDDTGSAGLGLCQICYDKKIDCIFLPCEHARTCERCATKMRNSEKLCPWCKEKVEAIDHIYS